MNKWLEIPSAQRAQILQQIAIARHLDATAIEKDWWVTMCLTALFRCRCADYINFKGGTSLSKCWHLIDRMSEDIDIAVDRKFFGLDGEITRRKDITVIRQALCSYVLEDLSSEISDKLSGLGLVGFNVNTPLTVDSSTDPQIIEVEFDSVLPSPIEYLRPKVLIEIGARSMTEPCERIPIRSILAEHYPEAPFADAPVTVNVATPGRTFLEKIFLIHEEMQKPSVRIDRMSRHLYDIAMMKDKPFAKEALADTELYKSIVHHRETLTHVSGIDYSHHAPQYIKIVPTGETEQAWRNDYESMLRTMIYGEQISFDEIMKRLVELQEKVNEIEI